MDPHPQAGGLGSTSGRDCHSGGDCSDKPLRGLSSQNKKYPKTTAYLFSIILRTAKNGSDRTDQFRTKEQIR
ncbi:hypothetical protein F511_07200 [Dorcoceras hygrometricum]|uniref:Uncharacterized protein n=1 Tax=Dorcoceras hygrometricum TaxID=472368 RepID=A0A2Z7AQL0_9LAMI|nr:hypothetical protein F511_07200 [Dorcoceras hygrometricum]